MTSLCRRRRRCVCKWVFRYLYYIFFSMAKLKLKSKKKRRMATRHQAIIVSVQAHKQASIWNNDIHSKIKWTPINCETVIDVFVVVVVVVVVYFFSPSPYSKHTHTDTHTRSYTTHFILSAFSILLLLSPFFLPRTSSFEYTCTSCNKYMRTHTSFYTHDGSTYRRMERNIYVCAYVRIK